MLPRTNTVHQNPRIRLRVVAIDVSFRTPRKYPVNLKVLAGKSIPYNLKAIGRDQVLRWDSIDPIEVDIDDSVEIRVYETYWFERRRERVGSVTFQVCKVTNLQSTYTVQGHPESILSSVSLTFSSGENLQAAQSSLAAAGRVVGVPSEAREITRTPRNIADAIMKIGRMVIELSPMAESAVRLCSQAWEILQQQARDDALVARLVDDMDRMITLVAAAEDHAKLLQLKTTIAEMLALVEDISRFVIDYKSNSTTFRMAVLADAQNRVDEFARRSKHLMREFNSGMAAQLVQRVEKLINDSDWALVDKLTVPGAYFDPSRCCLEGTRVRILDDIESWARDANRSTSLYWLYGPAGSGKSSIAASISERLDKTGILAGTFFCKRDNEYLRKPEHLISSLAASLASKCQPYGLQLVEALRNDRRLAHSATRTRFEGLIANPIRTVNGDAISTPLVIVVDALDENGTVDSRKELVQCLLCMAQMTKWLKVIMTSRPNDEIRHLLELNQEHILSCDLFTRDPSDLSQDIRAYIQYRMSSISLSLGRRDHWPDEMEIKQLCTRSNNLFIWAHTACNLIEQSLDPPTSLYQILAGVRHLGPKQALGDIYTTALDECLRNNIDDTETIRLCVGAIVLTGTRCPLSDASLAALLGKRIKLHVVTRVIDRLGSVIYRDVQGAIRVLHHSFSDYMVDESCPERYRIDTTTQNAALAASCLEVMMVNLRFNICGLGDSRMLNQEVPNLRSLVEENIRPELAYSSLYWATHLSATTLAIAAQSCGNLLDLFMFGPRLMHWIEALSLLGELHVALSSMHQLESWVNNPHSKHAICARDVYRFVSAAFMPISSSTPHLYISAFPFGEANYTTFRKLKPWFPNTLTVSLGKSIWKSQPLCTINRAGLVSAIAFSPDGRYIVSGSADNTLRVWDAHTGAAMFKPWRGHSDLVVSVAFSSSGRYIISGSDDSTVRIWEARNGSSVLEPLIGHSDGITSVASSPEDGRILSGSRDGTVKMWDIKTGEILLTLSPPEGAATVTCSRNGTITISEMLMGEVTPVQLQRSSHPVAAAVFSPDGRRVLVSYSNRTLQIWDAETGLAVFEKRYDHPGMMRPIAFSPDARHLASGFADRTVRIWDIYTIAPILEPLTGHSDFITSISFSPNGQIIASGGRNGMVRAWDAQTGNVVLRSLRGHSRIVTSLSFSPDCRKVASGSYDDTIQIWDVQDSVPTFNPLQGPSDSVTSIALCPSGRRVASGSWDHTVQIWDMQKSVAIGDPLRGHMNVVTSVTFSPDGHRIVSGSADWTLRVWDALTGALALGPLEGHAYHVTAVAFSFDGQRIVSGSADMTIRIWDAQTGVAVLKLQGHADRVTSVAFSPDGQRIVSGSDDSTLRIWDARTGVTLVGPLRGHAHHVTSVAYSADGQLIASGGWDKSVRIWNAHTGAAVHRPLHSHSSTVSSVAFSPDNRQVVSGSNDKTICVWNAQTGCLALPPLQGHSDHVNSVALSSDGKHIVSGSRDKTIRIWDAQAFPNSLKLQHRSLNHASILNLQGPGGENTELVGALDSENWVYSQFGERLFWFPKAYQRARAGHAIGAISAQLDDHPVTLDISNFVVGLQWTSAPGFSIQYAE